MKRRSALLGFTIALALAASACGGGSGGDAAVSIKTLQAAVSNTQDAPSSRFTLTVATDLLGQHFDIQGTGVMSGDRKTMQIQLSLPVVGSVEERLLDRVLYVNLGSLDAPSSKLPAGKQWVSVDLDALKSATGHDLGSLVDQAQSAGPTQGLEYLQGLSGDVTKVGDDTVAGEPATHYRASIDYAKVADKLHDASPDVADKIAKLGTVPADVWINDDDRVVKMHFAINGGALGGHVGNVELTMEITDFGVPVDVQAPPADQTVDLLTLKGQDQTV